MILSDRDIIKNIENEKIKITPEPDLEVQLGSCSIDFRLGNTFRIFESNRYSFIDLRGKTDLNHFMKRIEITDEDAFVMQPGEFVLAATKEKLELSNDLMARLEGRSSLGRLGLIVHSTAGVFDPGWIGIATLELGNLGRMPLKLYPGMRICSFTFEQLSSPARVSYRQKKDNKYSDQMGPEVSRYMQDKELENGISSVNRCG